jgi:hypothetical protein
MQVKLRTTFTPSRRAGFAVAQTYQRPVASVLRYRHAAFLLVAERDVLQAMWTVAPSTCRYYESPSVSAADLASFSEPYFRKRFPGPDDPRSQQCALRTRHRYVDREGVVELAWQSTGWTMYAS